MNKTLIVPVVVISIGVVAIVGLQMMKSNPNKTDALKTVPTPTSIAPSIDGKGRVELFLKAISAHEPNNAVDMMTEQIIGDPSQRQGWVVQLGSFQTLEVKNIESSMQEEWKPTKQTYKVTMDVEMRPESGKAVIPFYGYDNGTNICFISVEKTGNDWKIMGIATGP